MPTKRPHSPLSRLHILEISLRQPPRNKGMFEPAVMPLAHRLCPAAVKIGWHQPSAKDAFTPSARRIAALCDESSDRSLFAVGGCFDVALGRRGKLEEEVSSREFQGYEARGLDVSGDLLDEFGGKRGEVRCVGQVDCLILPVRHCGSDLFVRLLLLMVVVRMVRFLCCCNGGDSPRLVTPGEICLPAARLLACSVGQGWTPRVTVSVPGTSGERKVVSKIRPRADTRCDGYTVVRQDNVDNKDADSKPAKQRSEKGSLTKYNNDSTYLLTHPPHQSRPDQAPWHPCFKAHVHFGTFYRQNEQIVSLPCLHPQP
jgi:hypothetical protein